MTSKTKLPSTLVVGSDGLVGHTLINFLRKTGRNVLGTTRRSDCVNDQNFFLDLSKNVEYWKSPLNVQTAVVCAGITRIEACQNTPEESKKVNVDGISMLIKNLVAAGIFVIYLSTNQVFDGSKPYRMPDDALCPITEYGRQKAEAESFLHTLKDNVAIVRFSKILSTKDPLFEQWKTSLKKGEVIYPFWDMVLAPVPLDFVIKVLQLVIDKHLSGVLQVSGGYDLSYAEAAYLSAKYMKVESSLIQPISAYITNRFKETLPTHTTLNCDRLKREFKILPPDVRWTIQKMFS